MKRIIWDIYFDPSISRKYGRRVSKGVDVNKLEETLRLLQLDYSVTQAKYPRVPWRSSKRFEIDWSGSKWRLIKEIEKKIRQL